MAGPFAAGPVRRDGDAGDRRENEHDGERRIRVGRLGVFLFPAGRYVYVGSGRRNLSARIARHRRKRKLLHWHIDYFLRYAVIVEVERSSVSECALAARVGGWVVASGFGASDCGCRTHLFKVEG